MSYSGRVRYKSMREKNLQTKRRVKAFLLGALLFGLIVLFFNWVSVRDYLMTYFY